MLIDKERFSKFSKLLALTGCCYLAGCAHPSVMDLDANTVQVSTNAAPICGGEGAQKAAVKLAAIETIKHGFDRYIILGAQAATTQQYAGSTPIVANSYGSGTVTTLGNSAAFQSQSTTYVTGGTPIILNRHNQALQVRMYAATDPQAINAIDARRILGAEWQKLVAKGTVTTCTE